MKGKKNKNGRPSRGQRRTRSPGKRPLGDPFASRAAGFTSLTLRAGQICADRVTVPMKYTEFIQIGAAGGQASYIFSQNSAYDPNVTSTGGTVQGFDTYNQLYSRYRVLSSSMRVTCQQTDNATAIAVAIAPTLANVGSAVSAQSVSMYRHAKPKIARILPVAGFGPATVLEDSINTSELLGCALFDEQSHYGIGPADPTVQFYWAIGTSSLTTASYAINAMVELEYVVEWSQPNDNPI